MTKTELKELLTPEFLSTLHSAVECCNWDNYNEEELTYLLENIDNLITEVISIETEEVEE